MNELAPVTSIPTLDLTRYLGSWFEIGRLPLKWQDADSTDVTATYSLNEDDTVAVDNRCFDDAGEPVQALGRAELVDGQTSQLTVSFLPKYLRWIPFTEGDYWVLALADDYTVALVGTPDHEHLWLLARDHSVTPDVTERYLDVARAQGFDLTAWITTPQSGRRVTDELLAGR